MIPEGPRWLPLRYETTQAELSAEALRVATGEAGRTSL